MLVGFSTGFLYQDRFSCNDDADSITDKINILKKIGCNAIELSGLKKDRFDQIKKISKRDLDGFEYVSLHAPKDQNIFEALTEIAEIHLKLNFNLIVLHPDTIDDWSALGKFNLPLAIENMDKGKSFGKTVKELEPIVDSYDLGIVLDINHVYTNDKSLKSLIEFYGAFGNRIKEIHISGFQTKHEPLVESGPIGIVEAIRATPDKKIPVIIESHCGDINQAKSEYNLVVSNLARCFGREGSGGL